MADRFQNGLLLTSATASQCGRTFARWLAEFATQICGMTLFDSYDVAAGSYTNTQATGANGASVAATPQQFDITGDGYTFTSADLGRYITIHAGMPTGFEDRHGIYRITSIVSTKIVELEIRHGVHDAGIPHPATSMDWRLWGAEATDVPSTSASNYFVLEGDGVQGGAYNWHCKVVQQTSDAYFPRFEVGPFAATDPWIAGAPGSWTGGGKQTATFDGWTPSNSTDNSRIYACGDSDRIIVAVRQMDNSPSWNFLYIGEIDAFYDNSVDPNPVMVWNGHNHTSDYAECFGRNRNASAAMYNGGRGLAANDTTTLTYLATFFQVSPGTGNLGWTVGTHRRWSARTRRIYRQALIAESQTSGNMELRGSLRGTWLGNTHLLRGTPFGRNAEFLHIVGGLIIPWNGSGVHEQRV